VMEDIPAWKKALGDLKTDFEKTRASMEAKQAELKKKYDQLEAKRTVTGQAALQSEVGAFQKEAQEFQAEFSKAQQSISEREAGLKEVVLGRIEQVVQALAAEKEYDYVFEAGPETAPNVLYAAPAVYITNDVVAGYKKAFGDKPITVPPRPAAPKAK
jgi:Skp family chaperone for outer membrane proteins